MSSTSSAAGAVACRAWTGRKLGGGGNPTTRWLGDFSDLRCPAVRGCRKLGFDEVETKSIWIWWLHLEGIRQTGARGVHSLGHPCQLPCPHSHPALGPELLRLPGYDASPAPSGLRGISGTFLFEFYFLLKILLLMSLFLALLVLRCCLNFSLVAETKGYFLVAVFRLLVIVVASLMWTVYSRVGGGASIIESHELRSFRWRVLEHRLISCHPTA